MDQANFLMLQGLGVSSGIGIGQAIVLRRGQTEVPRHVIQFPAIDAEILRFQQAVDHAIEELEFARTRFEEKHLPIEEEGDLSAIMDVQIRLLQGSRLIRSTERRIKDACLNAEAALDDATTEIASAYAVIEDTYLSERIADIRAASIRVRRILMRDHAYKPTDFPEGTVLVSEEFTPGEIVMLDSQRIAGIVSECGGTQGHTAILARALGIPAILGVENVSHLIHTGQNLALSGDRGIVYLNPLPSILRELRQEQKETVLKSQSLDCLIKESACTFDGKEVRLFANIELPQEVDIAKSFNANGIGLMRSEFLFLGRQDIPSEEEQFSAFKKILSSFSPQIVTIRTLDIGADKASPGLKSYMHQDDNPALGVRGVRFSLVMSDILKTQLRAILRASVYGNVRILVPMVTISQEMQSIREIIEETYETLKKEKYTVPDSIPPIGAMIEVPAAALNADNLATYSDFFAIGSNDLMQYTLAVDRSSNMLSGLFDTANPAIFKLMKIAVDAGIKHNIPVSICGEIAGDPLFTALLLGLGVTDLSMQANALLKIKERIRTLSFDNAQRVAQTILDMGDPCAVRAILKQSLEELPPSLCIKEKSISLRRVE
jgi:phosphoenolpyruvate-protein phosphotransferase (PTS system enzyme I)